MRPEVETASLIQLTGRYSAGVLTGAFLVLSGNHGVIYVTWDVITPVGGGGVM